MFGPLYLGIILLIGIATQNYGIILIVAVLALYLLASPRRRNP